MKNDGQNNLYKADIFILNTAGIMGKEHTIVLCWLWLLSSCNTWPIDPNCFNPFPNKSWFIRVCSISLLKTLWEKEKLLKTSNFSFSHSVLDPFE